MSREVRRVPKDWKHPKCDNGNFIALFDGGNFTQKQQEWDEGAAKWANGLRDDGNGGWKPLKDYEKDMTFEEWYGSRPNAEDYMPEWTDAERTHLMMYETTSEGTPISPVFETPEELAQWLADNNASVFGDMTATYEQWLGMCKAGWAPSAVCDSTGIHSGVEAISAL
jgi:hypothetical protein